MDYEHIIAATNQEAADIHRLNGAIGWYGLGDYQAAINELDQMVSKIRDHPRAIILRCQILSSKKDLEGAVQLAKQYIERIPDSRQVWVNLCAYLLLLERWQEAYECLKTALAKWPDEALLYYNLACYYCKCGQLDQARKALDDCLGLNAELISQACDDPYLKELGITRLHLVEDGDES